MTERIDNVYFNDEPIIEKTPVFLKVLCILTFVSCGFTLLTVLYQLTIGDSVQEQITALENGPSSTQVDEMAAGMRANMGELQKWTNIAHYLAFLNIALTFTGALMMWKRKKTGFYIYIVGHIVALTSLFFMYNVMKDIPLLGVITLITDILIIVFMIAFIIMYGLNLKHMR